MTVDGMLEGIPRGKGTAWVNQAVFYFGRAVFKQGLKGYFEEFA